MFKDSSYFFPFIYSIQPILKSIKLRYVFFLIFLNKSPAHYNTISGALQNLFKLVYIFRCETLLESDQYVNYILIRIKIN